MINTKFKVMFAPPLRWAEGGRGTKGQASPGGLDSAGDVLFLTLGD